MNDTPFRPVDFVNELMELFDRHGMYVWGCGCCDSPYLMSKDQRFVPSRKRVKEHFEEQAAFHSIET